eukprot:s5378_g3.t1
MEFGTRGIGGEIKVFPPPVYHGELEKWEDWSWQYVGLYKPLAKLLMDDVEGSNVAITDDLCEAFNVQQNRTQNDQLSLFSRQLAYMLAQITDGAARAIVRNEDTENGFEIWRRLHSQFSLPERARSTNLLNEIIRFRLRSDHLESDLSEFIILKNRHEKTTGRPLDNDLLVTLNGRNINTFNEALEIIYRSGAEWYDEWNQWSPDDWLNDDWSLEEQDWNGEWIGSVNDWSGDWSWFEDDWSSWPEDWSWNTQEWWNPTEAQPQSSNGAASSGSNVPQDTAKNEPPQNVSAVTVVKVRPELLRLFGEQNLD